MKFSWIIVLALSALSVALGAKAIGLYCESQMSASQVACVNDQVSEIIAQGRLVQSERDRLAVELQEQLARIQCMEEALSEEKKTHEPLRKQIEQMNTERGKLGEDIDRMTSQVDAMKGEKGKLGEDIARMAAEIDKLGRDLADKRDSLTQAASLKDELGRIKDELERTKKELADSKKQAEDDRKGLESMSRAQIMKLEKELSTAKLANEDLKKNISRLESSVKAASSAASEAAKPEVKQP